MKIDWTENAIKRIEDIAEYIAKDSPSASQKWKSSIYRAAQSLNVFPRRGRKVPEVERDDLREIFLGNYRIIYRLESKRIAILTVRHGRQLLKRDDISDR